MKFEFAKYTEITDFAFKVNPEYKNNNYIRVFLCPDVNDFWLVRILEGYDEDYDTEEGSYILERNKISNNKKGEIPSIKTVRELLVNDDFSNWDFQQSYNLEELISMLDEGHGIINIEQ